MIRVTTVLDFIKEEGLIDWLIKTGKREAKRQSTIAKNTGTRVHELIEQDLKDGSYKFKKSDNFEVQSCLTAWDSFKIRHEVKPVTLEEELVNEELGVVGHRDFKGYVDGKLTTLDYKTSTKLTAKNVIQVNVYDFLGGIDTPYVSLLRLDKSLGIFDYQCEKYSERYVDVFKSMLDVYRFYQNDTYGIKLGDSNDSILESSPTNQTGGDR